MELTSTLRADVHGFGELLYSLATGHEVPADGSVDPGTPNTAFNAIVNCCLESESSGDGYVCIADEPALA